jgi:hypothetical protein
MSEYYFNKSMGRYYLQFKTNHIKLLGSKIKPPITFSMYCMKSKNPVVVETVESILKDIK